MTVTGAATPPADRRLVAVLCVAEVLGMAGFAGFPALLPTFASAWELSSTDAGWIGGIFFAGYMIAVPVLVSLTDRIDARGIYLVATALGGVASLGYALAADGFWTAMAFRALAGVGLAGTYMPGLKLLSDRLRGRAQARSHAVYTSCFSVGAAVSFLLAGEVARAAGWRWAFGAAALGSVLAIAVVLIAVPRAPPPATARVPTTRLLDFRPVLRSRRAVAHILAYGTHMWELYGQRSWMVAFLLFNLSLRPGHDASPGGVILSATMVAMLVSLAGVPANLLGNEAALRLGRVRVAAAIALASAALSLAIGLSATAPYAVLVALCLVYGALTYGDSAALIGGAVEAAPPGRAGATLAVLSFVGFAGSFLGALSFGVMLDLAGGVANPSAWTIAFGSLALVALLGPLALATLAGRASR